VRLGGATTAARTTTGSARCCTGAEYTRARIERIGHHTDAQVILEQVTRYHFAAPLIAGARAWCDIRTTSGVGASAALPVPPPEHTLLVHGDAAALRAAARELEALRPETLVNALTGHDDLRRLGERLRHFGEPGPRCITAFGSIERAGSLEAMVAGLERISSEDGWDVIVSFGSDPGAIEELRSLLSTNHVVARQRPLQGSRIDPASPSGPHGVELRARLRSGDDGGAADFLIAFGPRSGKLAPVATVADADLSERRALERRREARLAYLERLAGERSTGT